MDGHVYKTISLSKIGNSQKYKELILREIIAAVCAMLNSNGGKVVLYFDSDDSEDSRFSQMSFVRTLEQNLISIIGLIQFVSKIKFGEDGESKIILVKQADSLITTYYNLYLPSESQVVQVSPWEQLEKVKDIINRKVVPEPVQPGSHCKIFQKSEKCSFHESRCIQIKCLNACPSTRTTLADRMTCKGNKFRCYASAFANYSGGCIYYGITDDGVVEGEWISHEKDKNEITKKVGKVFNKMIWPNHIGKAKRAEHWDIFFEPVVAEDSKPIPSTYVIVIYIAPCLGGVFTEKPKCYEIVEGNVEEMSLVRWRNMAEIPPKTKDAPDTGVDERQARSAIRDSTSQYGRKKYSNRREGADCQDRMEQGAQQDCAEEREQVHRHDYAEVGERTDCLELSKNPRRTNSPKGGIEHVDMSDIDIVDIIQTIRTEDIVNGPLTKTSDKNIAEQEENKIREGTPVQSTGSNTQKEEKKMNTQHVKTTESSVSDKSVPGKRKADTKGNGEPKSQPDTDKLKEKNDGTSCPQDVNKIQKATPQVKNAKSHNSDENRDRNIERNSQDKTENEERPRSVDGQKPDPVQSTSESLFDETPLAVEGVQRENRDATRQSDRTQDHTDRRNNSYSRDQKDQRDQRDQDKSDQRNRNERNRTDQRERTDRRDRTDQPLPQKQDANRESERTEKQDEYLSSMKKQSDIFTVGTLSPGVDRRRYNDTCRGDASSRRGSHGGTRGMRGRGRGRVISSGKSIGKGSAASKNDDENDSEDYHSAHSSVDSDESDSEEVFDKQDDGRRDDKRPTRSYYSSSRSRGSYSSRGRGRGGSQITRSPRKQPEKPPRFQRQEARSASRDRRKSNRGGFSSKDNWDENISKNRDSRNSDEGPMDDDGRFGAKSTIPAALTTHGRRPASPQSDFVEVKSKRTQEEQRERAREEEERKRHELEKMMQDAMLKPKTNKSSLKNKQHSTSKPPRFARNTGVSSNVVSTLPEGNTLPSSVTHVAIPENNTITALASENVEQKRVSPLMLERPSSPPTPPMFNAWTKPLSLTPAKPPNEASAELPRITQPDPLAVERGKPLRTDDRRLRADTKDNGEPKSQPDTDKPKEKNDGRPRSTSHPQDVNKTQKAKLQVKNAKLQNSDENRDQNKERNSQPQRDNRTPSGRLEQRSLPGQSEMLKHVHAKPFQPLTGILSGSATHQIAPNVRRAPTVSGQSSVPPAYHVNKAVLSMQATGATALQGSVSFSDHTGTSPIVTPAHALPVSRLSFHQSPTAVGSCPRQVPVHQLTPPNYPTVPTYRTTGPSYTTSVANQPGAAPMMRQSLRAGRGQQSHQRLQDRRAFYSVGAAQPQMAAYQFQVLPRHQQSLIQQRQQHQQQQQQQQQMFRNHQQLSNAPQFPFYFDGSYNSSSPDYF